MAYANTELWTNGLGVQLKGHIFRDQWICWVCPYIEVITDIYRKCFLILRQIFFFFFAMTGVRNVYDVHDRIGDRMYLIERYFNNYCCCVLRMTRDHIFPESFVLSQTGQKIKTKTSILFGVCEY